MKSWQSSLKFSISQLNSNGITTKLFNPSVVWQGSVVFGEVICYCCCCSLLILFVLQSFYYEKCIFYLINLLLMSFQGQTRTELPGFSLCFEKSKKKVEPNFSFSLCQAKRF